MLNFIKTLFSNIKLFFFYNVALRFKERKRRRDNECCNRRY